MDKPYQVNSRPKDDAIITKINSLFAGYYKRIDQKYDNDFYRYCKALRFDGYDIQQDLEEGWDKSKLVRIILKDLPFTEPKTDEQKAKFIHQLIERYYQCYVFYKILYL